MRPKTIGIKIAMEFDRNPGREAALQLSQFNVWHLMDDGSKANMARDILERR
jgi:hypothetical protein